MTPIADMTIAEFEHTLRHELGCASGRLHVGYDDAAALESKIDAIRVRLPDEPRAPIVERIRFQSGTFALAVDPALAPGEWFVEV